MNSLTMLWTILFVALFGQSVLAQNNVPCHKDIFQFTPRHTLNITAFLGAWYSHEYATSHIGNTPVPDYKCRTNNFTMPDPAQPLQLNILDMQVDIATDAVVVSVDNIAVNATRSPLSSVWTRTADDGQVKYVILLAADLEFSKWAVFYQCEHIGEENYRFETVTAYTRSRMIDPELRAFLKALMVGVGFHIEDHQTIRQDIC